MTFAGWKNNGGGYQVWIAHGSGLYTTYNHMSAITVGAGQHVSRGTQVGRIGMSGDATGPHLPLRGLAWPRLERRDPGQPAGLLLGARAAARSRPAGVDRAPCENDPDVPRPREDLGPRRRWWRRSRDLPAGGPRPARRSGRRRRRSRRLGLPAGGRGPDHPPRLQPPPPFPGDARRPRHQGPSPRQGRRRPGPRRPARDGRLRRRIGRAGRRPRRRRSEHDGRPRRARRSRQHALQDLDAPGAQACPEGRARRRGVVAPRAPADRRHRPRRAAERRQVHHPCRGDGGDSQGSPTIRSPRWSRTSA